jgi:uncharacterized membrane protein
MTNHDDKNMVLYIAAYGDDAAAAKKDYTSLNQIGDMAVVASVLLSRNADGKVTADEHGGRQISAGTAAGVMGGLLIGLFAPPLLAATAVGAGIGAGVGAILKRHDQHKIASSVEAEDWLTPDSLAIVAIIDDEYLDRANAAVANAVKTNNKAIDKGDYDALIEALGEGGQQIVDAVDSAAS